MLRRLTVVLVALASFACLGRSPAPAPAPVPKKSEAAVTAPARFELTEGKAVDVGHGVTVTLKSVLYAHLSGSRNNSLMQLVVTHAGKTEEVTLERLEPGPPKYHSVFGVQLGIDYVDAYHQPSTGAVFVQPAAQ